MEKLKERLQPLKLTAQQKESILQNAASKPKKQFAFIPIIMPAFVVLALCLVALAVVPSDATRTNAALELFQSEPLPLRYIIIMSVSTLLMLVVYVLMRKTLAETKRWQQHAFAQELYAVMTKRPVAIAVLVIIAAAMWIGVFYFPNRWYVEGLYMFWVYWFVAFIFLIQIKDFERVSCPHCGQAFTNRQILVKMSMQYRERCHACEKLVYVSKRSKPNTLVVFFWPTIPLWIGNFASVHEGLIVVCSLLSLVPFLWLYVPAMAEFTKENEDPEKLA